MNLFSLFQELKSKIADRSALVTTVGLGYVGLPLALTVHEEGFPVLGFDLNESRVTRINAGEQVISYFAKDRIAKAMIEAAEKAGDLVPDWQPLLTPPGELHSGGPVERSSFLGLGAMEGPRDEGIEWWTPIAHGVGLVNLAGDVEEAADALEALRIYHGYTGWGGGQLDAEIGENSWFVVDADPEDPFTERPDRLWNTVLGRQRGELAMYGTYPEDAKVN